MRRASLSIIVLTLMLGVVAPARTTQKKQPARSPQKPNPTKRESDKRNALVSKQEQEIISEINLARSHPIQYARYVEDFRRLYRGKVLNFSDGSMLVTNEGVAAVDEAIGFLRSAQPAPPLEVRAGLVLAAKAHLNDLVTTGRTGHKGSDGSKVEDRFSRYGTWSDSVGEDIIYHSRSARENVMSLIIDDGVSNRGHRKNIFKASFHVIGVALGTPDKSPTLCIITFAGGYVDNPGGTGKTPAAQKY